MPRAATQSYRVDPSRLSHGRSHILNLVFHGVAEAGLPSEGEWWLDQAAFERVLDSLVGRPDIRITFDDGFASDATIALPALLERGLHASFFITTNWLGTPGHVSVEDVAELVRCGMAVGSHGVTHKRWVELSRRELDYELEASRARLEDITGGPITLAASPRGAYDRAVLSAVRDAGFDFFFSTDHGTVRRDAWLQRRTIVYPSMIGPEGLRLPARPAIRVRLRQALARWR